MGSKENGRIYKEKEGLWYDARAHALGIVAGEVCSVLVVGGYSKVAKRCRV